MAGWPAQADYRDALQNADLAFRDPVLRACKVERNKMGVPKARSGAFASVYKLIKSNGEAVALKLFNFPSEDRQRRYEAVSKHLAALGAKRPDSLVGFHYSRDGINIGGKSYPFQTMDWVKGESLGEWARQRMKAKDTAAMRSMADHWVKLVITLQSADIAHGDLQHDNVMIANGKPMLVDYDGMWVPALDGADPLEFGKPAYQHPRRGEMKLHRGLDHFSAWIILLALRASATEPMLYERFVFQADNENVLFSEADLKEPKESKLWPELLKCKDAEVAKWAAEIRAALELPAERVPPFSMDPFHRLRELCDAGLKDWEAIFEEADRLKNSGRALTAESPQVLGAVQEAWQRVIARNRVRDALIAGDVRAVANAYSPSIFENWPNQRGLGKQAAAARDKVKALDELKAAIENPGDGSALAALWAKHSTQLIGVKEAENYCRTVEMWKNRQQAVGPYLAAVNSPMATEKSIADAWKHAVASGAMNLIPTNLRLRGEQATKRNEALTKLRGFSGAPSESSDQGFLNVWLASAVLLKECPEADPFHARQAAVKQRLDVLKELDELLKLEWPAPDVLKAATALPAGYTHHLQDRVRQLQESIQHLAEVRAALAAAPISDSVLASAWRSLKLKDAKQASQLPAEERERCELAEQRAIVLERLKSVPFAASEAIDRALIGNWVGQERLLEGCMEAVPYRGRVKAASDRLDIVSTIEGATKRANTGPGVLQELALAGAKLPVGYQHRFVAAIENAKESAKRYAILQSAMSVKPLLDVPLAEAWEKFHEVAPAVELPRALVERCKLAILRRDAVHQFDLIVRKVLAVDDQDRRLLKVWKEHREALAECAEFAAWKERIALAERRHSKAKKLLIGLDRKGLGTVLELADDPDLVGYAPIEKKREAIREMAAVAARLVKLREGAKAAKSGMSKIDADDFQFLRERERFLDDTMKRTLARMVEVSMGPLAGLEAGVPPFQLQPGSIPSAKVFWEWSGTPLVTRFLLAVVASPVAKPPDAPLMALSKCRPEDHLRDGGGRLVVLPRSGEAYVCIWAEADWGWGSALSPPLVIGPIRPV